MSLSLLELLDEILRVEKQHLELTAARAKRAARAVIIFIAATDLRMVLLDPYIRKHWILTKFCMAYLIRQILQRR